jgi:hypothetical protein
MWNKIVVKFEELSVNLPGSTGEFHVKSRWMASRPIFEPDISRIQSRSTTRAPCYTFKGTKTTGFVILNAIFQHLSDIHIKH